MKFLHDHFTGRPEAFCRLAFMTPWRGSGPLHQRSLKGVRFVELLSDQAAKEAVWMRVRMLFGCGY